jgi:hypothetical protein
MVECSNHGHQWEVDAQAVFDTARRSKMGGFANFWTCIADENDPVHSSCERRSCSRGLALLVLGIAATW